MKKIVLVGLLSLTGCRLFSESAPDAAVISPDGANEIRLWTKPLAYAVVRRGETVVAKTEIALAVGDRRLAGGGAPTVRSATRQGTVAMPVYKKSSIDLTANESFADFGDWGVRLVARNDGVAYRFETKLPGRVKVVSEQAPLTVPGTQAHVWMCRAGEKSFGLEEGIPESTAITSLKTGDGAKVEPLGKAMLYLPFAYRVGGACVAVTESDVRDYPIWELERPEEVAAGIRLSGKFEPWPKQTQRVGGWGKEKLEKGGRWVRITEHEDYLTVTDGTRTFPWRVFVLADGPIGFCEADIVNALAAPQAEGDFSWVKPGKVAWDWWNCFDNQGDAGCNTKTYERFIDFAAKTGVEYVIMDEGWSEKLDIWKFNPKVDVPHLIDYANKRGVGIVLWMAWAQIYGDEEHVAEHFAKLGAKGFKVDFMDRGDAEVARFLERFAAACAKHRMLIDYHGAYRPVGMQRKYPNILNYEGIHGLEQMKWHNGDDEAMMRSDVMAFYLRLTAGPMDYTPGAMINYPIGSDYRGKTRYPGSVGTRCRQLAMMALYEAPLQMLSDSPTNYEKNEECFEFMSKVPVVWARTVGLAGDGSSFVVAARQARDGSWYAAGLTDVTARELVLDTSFLGGGEWKAEVFRDAADSDLAAMHYVHERNRVVRAGDKLTFRLARGGGFVVKFTK